MSSSRAILEGDSLRRAEGPVLEAVLESEAGASGTALGAVAGQSNTRPGVKVGQSESGESTKPGRLHLPKQ